MKNNAGFSLVELVVYTALAAVVILSGLYIINMIISDFNRAKIVSKIQQEGRDALYVMNQDVRNTGFKSTMSGGTVITVPGTWVSAADSSSFRFVNGNPNDRLTIYKAVINNSSLLQSIDTIEYKVSESQVLQRTLKNGQTQVQDLSFGIEAIQYQFSADYKTWWNTPSEDERESCRFIKVLILVKSTNPSSMKLSKSLQLADISLSFNDKTVRRVYEQVVPVANNGVFP